MAGSSGLRSGRGLSASSDPEPECSGFSEMASREDLAASCTWGSRTGGTLLAVTWLVGSLAERVPPRVRLRQLAEVSGPRGGHRVRVAPGVDAAAPDPAAAATDETWFLVCPVSR